MKNVTLSADEAMIEAARERARSEQTTLNEQFRRWLAEYAGTGPNADEAIAQIHRLQQRARTGGTRFTREEMNER